MARPPSGTQRRNHIISESAGALNTCRKLNDRMAVLPRLRSAADNLLQRWPVSKRVNSSQAPDDDPTLIEKITLASHPT
jgi:hypothetical protein